MAKRATKRGAERTGLSGDRDLLICGASFAGLMVARQLAGSGADVLLLDRYEIGERQTSACAIPTAWLENLGLIAAEKQRFGSVLVHTAHGSIRLKTPWTFSTFDYRTLCDLLWQGCDADFETAKVNGRAATTDGVDEDDGGAGPAGAPIAIETDRGVIRAPLVVDALGWKRILATGARFQPPDAPLSRGLEVHPEGENGEFEIWINRRYVPAGYGWSFPAGDEVRVGIGSFDPKFPVRPTTDLLAADQKVEPVGYQGNWIPHRLRPATDDNIFFVGDSAGHCLPLTAEGIRPAFYFGAALGMELRAILGGTQTRTEALTEYARFSDSHKPQFELMLKFQKLVPRVPPRLVRSVLKAAGTGPAGRVAFNRYLDLAPPEFVRVASRPGFPPDQGAPMLSSNQTADRSDRT